MSEKTFSISCEDFTLSGKANFSAFDTRAVITSDLLQLVIQEILDYCHKLPESFNNDLDWNDNNAIMENFYLSHADKLFERIQVQMYRNSNLWEVNSLENEEE